MIVKMNGMVIAADIPIVSDVVDFKNDFDEGGLFYALTGETFGEWMKGLFLDFLHWVVEMSDCLVIVAMVFGLFGLAGSSRGYKGMYWTFFVYILFKYLGAYL